MAQEMGTQGRKKRPQTLRQARTHLGLLPMPEERQEQAQWGTECQEHFQTHTARVPPKYRYRRFFTS